MQPIYTVEHRRPGWMYGGRKVQLRALRGLGDANSDLAAWAAANPNAAQILATAAPITTSLFYQGPATPTSSVGTFFDRYGVAIGAGAGALVLGLVLAKFATTKKR